MPDWKRNREAKANLASKGWHGQVTDWPGRKPYYLHKDMVNHQGDLVRKRGEIGVVAFATLPDQVNYANKGMWLKPPTDDCTCTWCNLWRSQQPKPEVVEAPEPPAADAKEEPKEHAKAGSGQCVCGWESKAPKAGSRASALYKHIRTQAEKVAA